jgi:hypothetical protein
MFVTSRRIRVGVIILLVSAGLSARPAEAAPPANLTFDQSLQLLSGLQTQDAQLRVILGTLGQNLGSLQLIVALDPGLLPTLRPLINDLNALIGIVQVALNKVDAKLNVTAALAATQKQAIDLIGDIQADQLALEQLLNSRERSRDRFRRIQELRIDILQDLRALQVLLAQIGKLQQQLGDLIAQG